MIHIHYIHLKLILNNLINDSFVLMYSYDKY